LSPFVRWRRNHRFNTWSEIFHNGRYKAVLEPDQLVAPSAHQYVLPGRSKSLVVCALL